MKRNTRVKVTVRVLNSYDYLYIEGVPENRKNAPFYQKHGFEIMENGLAMQIFQESSTRN